MPEGSRVKGVAFRSVLSSLRTLRGRAVEANVLARLGDDLSNAVKYGGLVVGGWYPIAWYQDLLHVIRASTGEGSELVFEVGQQCSRDDLSGIYRYLVKLLAPETVFSWSQRLFSNYYSMGSVEVVASGKGHTRARWQNCTGFDENMWTEILGSSSEILAIAGARDVDIRRIAGGKNGCDWMEAEARWT